MLSYITCVKDDHESDLNCFTVGKSYPIIDYWERGVIICDDDNERHYLSDDYMNEYFETKQEV